MLAVVCFVVLGRPSFGQSALADEQKGQIWTLTAQRVWTDTRLKNPQPRAWKTVQEFNTWLTKDKAAKESELGLLLDAVIKRIGLGQPATPAQVARAIISEIAQRKAEKNGRLARVNLADLQNNLAGFAPLGTLDATDTTPDAAAPDSAAVAILSTTQPPLPASVVAEDLDSKPDRSAAPARARPGSAGAPEASYFAQHPYQTAALAGVLGLLLGAGLMRAFRSKQVQSSGHYSSGSTRIVESSEYKELRLAYDKLRDENKQLRTKLQRLDVRVEELEARLSGSPGVAAATIPTPGTPLDVTPAVAMPETMNLEDPLAVSLGSSTVAPAAEAPEVPLTRYGPVQETPFLEERKLTNNPLPRLALMLTVQSQQPDQASFTLNPHVDQEMLIGDGLNRLQQFFDYDPPLGGRINAVKAASPGILQRQADGWQVLERARLVIT
ncbi:hypothetical protein D0N36_04355 [Hymenobacter lapidiphilus]|nr:hypothetical protein D0N36_04355 [Hymenobacter sp. CCM 8763]